jgi:hypothetical protein
MILPLLKILALHILKYLCNTYNNFVTFQQGADGTIYYGFKYKDGKYSYVPIAGNRWYKTR